MSIASQIIRLQDAKSNIKSAIEAKGVSVPSTITLDQYPSYISSIPVGVDRLDELVTKTISYYDNSSVSQIGQNVFFSCQNLLSVNLPSVRTIGEGAFQECRSLSYVNLPSCTNIGSSAFFGNHAFTGFASISSGYTDIQMFTFAWCSNLSSVPNASYISRINHAAFYNCPNLRSISLPNVSQIGYNGGTVPAGTFESCTNLSGISLPSCNSIGARAFWHCLSLTELNMTTAMPLLSNMGQSAFGDCSNLSTITFNSVLTSVANYAFVSCTALNNVILPNTLLSVGQGTFSKCTGLYSLYIASDIDHIIYLGNVNAFASTPLSGTGTGTIYIPSSMYNSYKAATNWSKYSARMVSY